jgi:hypothetical protein
MPVSTVNTASSSANSSRVAAQHLIQEGAVRLLGDPGQQRPQRFLDVAPAASRISTNWSATVRFAMATSTVEHDQSSNNRGVVGPG